MNRGRKGTSPIGGYTIVETLIFLAFSAVFFFAAMAYIGGRQNREFFITAVRDFETKLLDIANDVSTGFYQSDGTLGCTATPTGPDFVTGGSLGTNDDCIFVGTVVKFGDGGNRQNFTQFALGGLRLTGGRNTTNLTEAMPKVIDSPGDPVSVPIGAGITVECVAIGNAGCNPATDDENAAIGFFTTFEGTSLSAQNGGVVQANALSFSSVVIGDSVVAAKTKINDPANYASPSLNPGVVICLKSGGTDQYALIRLGGGNSSSLTTTTEIKPGSSCA